MPLDLADNWLDVPLCVFDFETSGLDTETCGVCSVGAVRLENWQETDHFYSLINPECEIDEGASAIHGITAEQVKHAPTLVQVAPELLRVAQDALPAGYNAQAYDRPILHRFISGTECPLFDPAFPHWLDGLVIIRKVDRFVRGKGRHKLDATCLRWGVHLSEAHNSLFDARATGVLLRRLVEEKKVQNCSIAHMTKMLGVVAERQQRDFEAYKARLPAQETGT